MSVNNVTDAGAFLSQVREYAAKAAKTLNDQKEAERKKAMEAFGQALYACDKAIERVMDKHIESVAKSAKELAEYRKRKAIAERIRDSADERYLMNERIILDRINQRNELAAMKADDIKRRELQER
ncbi:MAG: hypothetical protein LBG29_00505 [Synergistaceae bacterium]|nr:hypothetical protein [Synergistaceae bacterium]